MKPAPFNRKRITFLVLALTFIAFSGLSCRLLSLRQPEYIHHSKPELRVNFEAFSEAGCIVGDYGRMDCTNVTVFSSMECDQIHQTDDNLGGLDPNLPLVRCEYIPYYHEQYDLKVLKDTYLYNSGCSLPFLVRYIVPQGGSFIRVSNIDELAKIFAPISSPEEALSYAVASTGLSALYDIQLPRNFRFLADNIEDTHVAQAADGFEVLLYDTYLCGCGPHTVSAIKVLVTPEGHIQVSDPQPIYQDPENDGLCID
jgi:hypothetical protein